MTHFYLKIANCSCHNKYPHKQKYYGLVNITCLLDDWTLIGRRNLLSMYPMSIRHTVINSES